MTKSYELSIERAPGTTHFFATCEAIPSALMERTRNTLQGMLGIEVISVESKRSGKEIAPPDTGERIYRVLEVKVAA